MRFLGVFGQPYAWAKYTSLGRNMGTLFETPCALYHYLTKIILFFKVFDLVDR